MDNEKGSVLSSETNELEIVEFTIGNNKFGINVVEVKEIIQPVKVTKIPHSHKNVEGIIELRGEVLSVIDVAKVLGLPKSENYLLEKFIVAEFNKHQLIFHVHSVTQIHRITLNSIEKPSEMYQGLDSYVTGVIHLNSEMILLLDFEKILTDINPNIAINN